MKVSFRICIFRFIFISKLQAAMENDKKTTTDKSVKIFISAIGIIVIAATLKELQSIVIPFVIAYILHFALTPFNTWLSNKKIPLAIVIVVDLVLMIAISAGVSQLIVGSLMTLSADYEQYATKLNTIVRSTAQSLRIRDPFFASFSLQRIVARIDYKALAGGAFSSIFDVTGMALLIIFFFAFIVGGHHAIYSAFKRRFSSKNASPVDDHTHYPESIEGTAEIGKPKDKTTYTVKLENTVKEITDQIQKYIITKLLVNLAAGIVVAVALWLLNVDYAALWGIFVFFFNFVPTIGAAVAFVFPALMALIQTGSWGFAGLTAGIVVLVQTIAFNFLEPMLIGRRLDMNPIVILLSVLIWGYLWGILGMLLAVPLTAIIKIMLSNSVDPNVKFIVDLMNQD